VLPLHQNVPGEWAFAAHDAPPQKPGQGAFYLLKIIAPQFGRFVRRAEVAAYFTAPGEVGYYIALDASEAHRSRLSAGRMPPKVVKGCGIGAVKGHRSNLQHLRRPIGL